MQTNLRPMSLGEILDRTAQLYRTNFLVFAGIAAIYAGALLVLNLAQVGAAELMRHNNMLARLPLENLGYLILIFPISVVFGAVAVAANNRAVAWLNLDQPATIRGAYNSILPRIGRYVWLTVIVLFFVYLPFMLLTAGYGVFLFVYARARHVFITPPANGDQTALAVVGLVSLAYVLLAVGAVVYAVIMALRYALAVPAAVVEDLPARRAIRRSIELTSGSRGRIFVLGLLIAAIQLGFVALTQGFFIVLAVKHRGVIPVWAQVTQQIVGFFTNSFIGPMYATGLTLFYYDQRVRKEGYDIEWMMEAAGMTAPPPPPLPEAPVEQPWPETELPPEPPAAPAEPSLPEPPETPHE